MCAGAKIERGAFQTKKGKYNLYEIITQHMQIHHTLVFGFDLPPALRPPRCCAARSSSSFPRLESVPCIVAHYCTRSSANSTYAASSPSSCTSSMTASPILSSTEGCSADCDRCGLPAEALPDYRETRSPPFDSLDSDDTCCNRSKAIPSGIRVCRFAASSPSGSCDRTQFQLYRQHTVAIRSNDTIPVH